VPRRVVLFELTGLLFRRSLLLVLMEVFEEGSDDPPNNSRFSPDLDGFRGSRPSICLIII